VFDVFLRDRRSYEMLESGTIGLRGVLALGRELVVRLSKTHQGQHLDQGAKRQARYRGYDILMQRRDLCWRVTMKQVGLSFPYFTRTHSRRLRNLSAKLSHKQSGAWTAHWSQLGRPNNWAIFESARNCR
jgi:hypothetical protein